MSFLSVEKISAGYGGHPILADFSFQLEQGCMMGILGANGCGKTTLLKTICGILPHKGTCLLEQTVLEQLSARRMDIFPKEAASPSTYRCWMWC